ncbi:MAG: nicotinate phosphoribosyltransferase, partial [Coriobacteriia bacterium]|nr:nicotinate phosphoribosyltransferase [Coriobacteriia bacterium]
MLNTWPAAPGSRALLTDLYQLTQAQGYFRSGLDRLEACFYLHFRDNPFKGGYTIACGMEQLVEIIAGFGFDADDCAYLAEVKSASGDPLFSTEFIDYLRRLEFSLDVAAVPEGSVIFPYEPLITVTGPILEAQLLETVMLNQVGFQSLIATKAARVCQAAEGPVAEFGLRRAQGPAGGIYASRAAIIGGCASTSNVEAGRLFDVP